MTREIAVTFNGEVVNCVAFGYFNYDEHRPNGECYKEYDYFNTDAMKDLANEDKNRNDPFCQFEKIEINTDDKWLISKNKDKDGLVLYTQMIPISNIDNVRIHSNSLKAEYVRRGELDDDEAEQLK